jgi:hypothetical protein
MKMAPSSYFADNYGEKLTNTLRAFSDKCWKRAALIIGAALAGYDTVPRPKDLPKDLRKSITESLGDALDECEIDNYLLVGNKIHPQLIMNRVFNNIHDYIHDLNKVLNSINALTEAFIDKYNEAVAEVRRVLNTARGRGYIYDAEKFYGLGLASIIAKAAGSVKPSDADIALHIVTFAIQRVTSPNFIMPILSALSSLRDKAPHRYIELLASALSIENLDPYTVEYIILELTNVLINYGGVVRGYAWPLVHVAHAYTNLLGTYLRYYSDKVENIISRVANLLNELDRLSPSLSVIAWAFALFPALGSEYVRWFMEKVLGIDVANKTNEVLKELNKMREQEKVKELMRDEGFMGYVESMSIKADEEAVKKVILTTASFLRQALALYRLNNDELDEAVRLFNETAEEYREIGAYENHIINRGWALRVEAIKDSLVDDELTKLRNEFQQLYKETFKLTAQYLGVASGTLGGYLVSLALTGDDKKINKLLEEHLWVLNANKRYSVLTRLMLNALLGPRGKLSSKLKGKLIVESRELTETFKGEINDLPALMVAFGIVRHDYGVAMCTSINDLTEGAACMHAVFAAVNNDTAVVRLREQSIDTFRKFLIGKLSLLKELGADVDALFNEFKGLVDGLDGKSLVQLIAPISSMAGLALMLYALVNGNEELAKAHALYGAVNVGEKLPTRLYLEAYRACCDLGSESFRRAIAKLFFYHV